MPARPIAWSIGIVAAVLVLAVFGAPLLGSLPRDTRDGLALLTQVAAAIAGAVAALAAFRAASASQTASEDARRAAVDSTTALALLNPPNVRAEAVLHWIDGTATWDLVVDGDPQVPLYNLRLHSRTYGADDQPALDVDAPGTFDLPVVSSSGGPSVFLPRALRATAAMTPGVQYLVFGFYADDRRAPGLTWLLLGDVTEPVGANDPTEGHSRPAGLAASRVT